MPPCTWKCAKFLSGFFKYLYTEVNSVCRVFRYSLSRKSWNVKTGASIPLEEKEYLNWDRKVSNKFFLDKRRVFFQQFKPESIWILAKFDTFSNQLLNYNYLRIAGLFICASHPLRAEYSLKFRASRHKIASRFSCLVDPHRRSTQKLWRLAGNACREWKEEKKKEI